MGLWVIEIIRKSEMYDDRTVINVAKMGEVPRYEMRRGFKRLLRSYYISTSRTGTQVMM